jgi:hypothetical protein
MKDMLTHLEKLRVQITECELVRDQAIDPEKRDLFNRLAEHHKVLASELERAIASAQMAPAVPVVTGSTGKT